MTNPMTNKVLTREPSEEMIRAGLTAHETVGDLSGADMFTRMEALIAEIFRAMFDAAPEAPEGGDWYADLMAEQLPPPASDEAVERVTSIIDAASSKWTLGGGDTENYTRPEYIAQALASAGLLYPGPSLSREEIEGVFHDFIRDDAPLNWKMTWTPALTEALANRLALLSKPGA